MYTIIYFFDIIILVIVRFGDIIVSIEELEKLRKKTANLFRCGIIVSFIAAAILFYIKRDTSYIFFGLFIGIALTIILVQIPQKKFRTAFKEYFVLNYLKTIFTDLIYKPEYGLDSSIIENTNMIDMGDRYSSEDYMSGKYKGINVVQADVHIEEIDNDDEGSSSFTLFKGRWMIFEFNKTFKSNLQIYQKGIKSYNLNHSLSKKYYNKVTLEDQEFNNIFTVYAQNEHEAFYILTPHFMERMKNISNNVRGSLLFCFINNKLHIGLYDNNDSFEWNIFKKLDENNLKNTIISDIKAITDFVDELNLDNTLFKEEK